MDRTLEAAAQDLDLNAVVLEKLIERGWVVYFTGDRFELRNAELVSDGYVAAWRAMEGGPEHLAEAALANHDPRVVSPPWQGEGADTLILHIADAERGTPTFDQICATLAAGGSVDVVVDGKMRTLGPDRWAGNPNNVGVSFAEVPENLFGEHPEVDHYNFHMCQGTPEPRIIDLKLNVDASQVTSGLSEAVAAMERFGDACRKLGEPSIDEKIAADIKLSVDEVAKLTDEQLAHWRLRLPTNSAARKQAPIFSGVLNYFPDAIYDVARLSWIGNQKHNPGEPLHWARGKSNDQQDTITRHSLESGIIDTDKVLHDTKVAWRALAQLQLTIERLRASGVTYPPNED